MAGSGLIVSGKPVPVPGLEIQNWLDDPALRLDAGDFRPRYQSERDWIHLVVVHTTRGIPGGSDNRPQDIRPGLAPGRRAEDIVRTWTLDAKGAGAHLIVHQDGTVACCADLRKEAAFHAGMANGPSIGIEMVQGGDASLYEGQLDATVRLVDALTRMFGIQRQIPHRYLGGPVPRFTKSLDDVVGVVGHRDLTARRGSGDPGAAIMNRFGLAGYETWSFELPDDNGGDAYNWRRRQRDIGAIADGVPGPKTVQRLADLGYPFGLWHERPGDRPVTVAPGVA